MLQLAGSSIGPLWFVHPSAICAWQREGELERAGGGVANWQCCGSVTWASTRGRQTGALTLERLAICSAATEASCKGVNPLLSNTIWGCKCLTLVWEEVSKEALPSLNHWSACCELVTIMHMSLELLLMARITHYNCRYTSAASGLPIWSKCKPTGLL